MVLINLLSLSSAQETSCSLEASAVKANMNNYITRYDPPQIDTLFYTLHDGLQSTILATWLLCYNKTFVDPYQNLTKNSSLCLNSLDRTNMLSKNYANKPNGTIKADLQILTDVVLGSYLDCYQVMNYTWKANLTDDCTQKVADFISEVKSYNNDIILGKNGTSHLNDLLLKAQNLRKYCNYGTLTKPTVFRTDTCQLVNQNWLAPLFDQLQQLSIQNQTKKILQKFYWMYQSLIRAQSVCINKQIA